MTTKTPQRNWSVALIVIGVLSVWFLWPQLSVIVLTALMAFIFYPLYTRLKRKNGVVAAISTLVVSFLVVLIPLGFVIIATIGQLASFAEYASEAQYWSQLPTFAQQAIEFTNNILEPITGNRPSITDQNIAEFLRNAIPALARAATEIFLNVLGSLPQFGVALIIYMLLFIEFLRHGSRLIGKIEAISPFDQTVTKHYLEKIGMMANAMVTGQLIISMIVSLISAGLLIPLGYGQYFFIFFVLFTILNFIPLGSGIILIPLVLYSMLTGQFWSGLIVLILYYLCGNLDPILRARFIPAKIQLSVGLTMVSTFCGIAYFGILGVVYGPIIMIVIVTTVDLYITHTSQRPTKRVNDTPTLEDAQSS